MKALSDLVLESAGVAFARLNAIMQWDEQCFSDALKVFRLSLLHGLSLLYGCTSAPQSELRLQVRYVAVSNQRY